jgi:hypothetical protein
MNTLQEINQLKATRTYSTDGFIRDNMVSFGVYCEKNESVEKLQNMRRYSHLSGGTNSHPNGCYPHINETRAKAFRRINVLKCLAGMK